MPRMVLTIDGEPVRFTAPRELSDAELNEVVAAHRTRRAPIDALGAGVEPGRTPAQIPPDVLGGFADPMGGPTTPADLATARRWLPKVAGAGLGAGASAALRNLPYGAGWVVEPAAMGAITGGEAYLEGRPWKEIRDQATLGALGALGMRGLGAGAQNLPRVGLRARAAPVERAAEQTAARQAEAAAANAAAQAEFQQAGRAAEDVVRELRTTGRLAPQTRVNVPTLSQNPLRPEDAAQRMNGLTGEDWIRARAELMSELNRMDLRQATVTATGQFIPTPGATRGGAILGRATPETREVPVPTQAVPVTAPAGAQRAAALSEGLEAGMPYVQGVGTVPVLETEKKPGVPLSAVGGAAAAEAIPGVPGLLSRLWHALPFIPH